jgi:hypothetical protein
MSIALPSSCSAIAAALGVFARVALCSLSLLALVLMPIADALAGPDGLAGPTVGELLAACERGVAQGNTGVDSALCEWYAVPCDCKLTRPNLAIEPWCMPASVSIDEAMLRVIGELRRQPDRSAPAEQVVPGILGRLYPCPR